MYYHIILSIVASLSTKIIMKLQQKLNRQSVTNNEQTHK